MRLLRRVPPLLAAASACPTFEEHASSSVEILDEQLFPEELFDTQIAAHTDDALSQFYRDEVTACVIVGWRIRPTLVAELSLLAIAVMLFRKGRT